jgi:hypothetical protein
MRSRSASAYTFDVRPAHRNGDAIRVAEPARPVRVGGLHGFGQQVKVIGAAEAEGAKIEAFEDVEDLDEVNAARAGGRHGNDLVAAIDAANGRTQHRLVAGEVVCRHDPAGLSDRGGDALGDRAAIEAVRPPFGDALERCGKVRLDEAGAASERALSIEEHGAGRRETPEPARGARK